MPPTDIYVGIVGPSKAPAHELTRAEHIGRQIAEAGWRVVCGGMGGVMEAACRGAQSAGGTTIGFLPGLSRDQGNDYLTVSIPTGLGEMRNSLLVRSSDVLVAVGGSWGTLSEIALALRSDTPVIGLGTWHIGVPDGTSPAPICVQDAAEVMPRLRSVLFPPESGRSSP